MKISARNVFKGKVTEVRPGRVNTEIIIDVTGGLQVVAMISKESADHLGLKKGKGADGGRFTIFPAADFFSDHALKAVNIIHFLIY